MTSLACWLLVLALVCVPATQALRRLPFAAAARSTIPAAAAAAGSSNPPLASAVAAVGLFLVSACGAFPSAAQARPEGVNRPDLLPSGPVTPLIDVANFLTKGQEKKVVAELDKLEAETGFKLRVLTQAYPDTPGLAIKDYWKVDGNTVVLVLDKGEGFNRKGLPSNIINLNIGANVDLVLPSQFWTRLTNKLGNQPYVRAVGADAATINAVEAITSCLADKTCTDRPFDVPSY